MADVHAELTALCDRLKIERVRMKPVSRHYAFDKRVEGVPETAQYAMFSCCRLLFECLCVINTAIVDVIVYVCVFSP